MSFQFFKISISTLVIILALIFQNANNLFSQNSEQIQSVKYIFEKNSHTKYKYSFDFEDEYDMAFTNLFVFYKRNISPFDFQSCSFYPSCSVYAIQSLEKKGLFLGIIATFDRLSRCNGMSSEKYNNYLNTKYLFDTVE